MVPCLLLILSALPTGVHDEQHVVTILNPEALPLRFFRHEEESQEELTSLATSNPKAVVTFPVGLYELRAGERGAERIRIPIPLPKRAQRPASLEILVESPRAVPQPGFIEIPPGPALIGDILGVGAEDERPAQVITVPRYWICEHEVTNAQYAEFLGSMNPKEAAELLQLGGAKCGVAWDAENRRMTVRWPDHPVVTVTWEGARRYAEWRGRQWGLPVALPTEVQWEKAARGPLSWTYAYGNLYTRKIANCESGQLLPVMVHGHHGFGLADTTGTALEWTPATFADPHGLGVASVRLRGGSFVLDGTFVRNSMRMHQRIDVKADDFGFRVVILETPERGK